MSRVAMSARESSGLVSRFRSVCEMLQQERFSDRLSKPLAFWVLPNDRRLPLALLNRTIDELIHSSFEDLASTPGIGRKKISSLVNLLVRATNDQPPSVPFYGSLSPSSDVSTSPTPGGAMPEGQFDADLVSEALWSQWTEVVRDLRLGNEAIGRVADSLRKMPTVIWTKTLGEYENLTLSQIRSLRTHGEKRVRCVMQVMHKAYCMVQRYQHESEAAIRRRLGSQRILDVANWVDRQVRQEEIPTEEDIRLCLAEPILKQIEMDCGESVGLVARQRLGLDGEILTVREQAHAIGVTRARIYQLLEDCQKVVDVRWPTGRRQLEQLAANMGSPEGSIGEGESLFISTRQLCFPERNQIEDRVDAGHDLNVVAPHFMRDQI